MEYKLDLSATKRVLTTKAANFVVQMLLLVELYDRLGFDESERDSTCRRVASVEF